MKEEIFKFAKEHKKILITVAVLGVIIYAYNSYLGSSNKVVNMSNPNDNAYKS